MRLVEIKVGNTITIPKFLIDLYEINVPEEVEVLHDENSIYVRIEGKGRKVKRWKYNNHQRYYIVNPTKLRGSFLCYYDQAEKTFVYKKNIYGLSVDAYNVLFVLAESSEFVVSLEQKLQCSWRGLKKAINELKSRGLIKEYRVRRVRLFTITEEGDEFLKELKRYLGLGEEILYAKIYDYEIQLLKENGKFFVNIRKDGELIDSYVILGSDPYDNVISLLNQIIKKNQKTKEPVL